MTSCTKFDLGEIKDVIKNGESFFTIKGNNSNGPD